METQQAIATKWAVDPMHSEVQFKVKHLVISTVTGTFKSFEGEMHSESEDFDGAEVSFKIDVNSIDTSVSDRDNHLKSDDFFAAAKFPHILFTNGKLNKKGADTFDLTGDLTLRDTKKPIVMKATLGGTAKDMYGNTKAGFEVLGSINRKEFGLAWNGITEAGGVVVGEEVKLNFNIQLAQV